MLFLLLLPLLLVAACDKVPLLAPTGTTITLFPQTTTVSLNSEIQIVATVIEHGGSSGGSGASTSVTSTGGTPVQNGTVITFTTTIGRIEPAEARTHNGAVTVKLITGGVSGTATITAYSGGASAQVTNLKIGTAAVKTVTVTSTPQSLGSSGGSALVQATVTDEGGNPLAGIPVTFATDRGAISPSTANSDTNGVATATLTTTTTAKVTATAGTVTSTAATVAVSAFGLSGFSVQPNATSAGSPVVFTVTPTTGANISNVRVDFGDGGNRNLGPISTAQTVVWTYTSPGNYTASATVFDASGTAGAPLTTGVIIGSLGVTLSSSPLAPTVGTTVTFTATLSGGTPQIDHFVWNFEDGSFSTTSPQFQRSFDSKGTKNLRLDVFGVGGGKIGTGSLQITVQ
jgi:adhesin/invasin